MAYDDYMKALKMGQKAFKSATAKGQYPYLPVLDEILSHVEIEGESQLGTMNIPLYLVVGTSTYGRTQAFASNFMPLLSYGSEFASKWSFLIDAQIEEGIHDAIKVYEYMNKYYVIEGNKRVSVLKYFGCPTVTAEVIRKLPKHSDDLDVQIYYEFVDFFKLTKIDYVQFSKLGSYTKLLEATGKNTTDYWTQDECLDFSSFNTAFFRAFKAKGGLKLDNVTCGDALLFYLSLYPYETEKKATTADIKEKLDKIWTEITLLGEDKSVELLMDPSTESSPHIVNSVLNIIKPTKKKLVAFVYDKEPSASDWLYAHELGRLHLDEVMGDELETTAFVAADEDEQAEELLENICKDGYDVIFTPTPRLIKASLKIAVSYPNVKILNCALNSSHSAVRTYYTRMYEAKFLTGLIAGSMCPGNDIGYVADYPIYGVAANINAFALGAQMVNPRAKIHLVWSSQKNMDVNAYFKENNISYISGQDMITPQSNSREYGLFVETDSSTTNLATSIYHWGAFYEALIHSISSGTFKAEEGNDSKALNYWWGLSAGVIDVICSSKLPTGTATLVEMIKQAICNGQFHPFSGVLIDQNGTEQCTAGNTLTPEEIVTMNWLNNNVIGCIPTIDDLREDAKPVVLLRGLDSTTENGGPNLL